LNLEKFVAPDEHFEHGVDPLPESNGYKYCVTFIDRFVRWPIATSVKDIETVTVACAFYDSWITNFGAPKILTTDQGSQFESQFFIALYN